MEQNEDKNIAEEKPLIVILYVGGENLFIHRKS